MKFILPLLFLASSAAAALNANSVFEVRSTATSQFNGGIYVNGSTGTDYTQQDTAQFSGADLRMGNSNSAVQAASHAFVATDVGNTIRFVGGYVEYFGNNGWSDLTAHARQNVTGDLDLQMEMYLADWTPAADANIFNKAPTFASGFGLRVLTTGELQWYYGTGSAYVNINSTVPTGITDATRAWVRVTVDVNNGGGGADIKFYTGTGYIDSGVTWTQLGATVVHGSVITIPSHSGIGARVGQPTTSITGRMYGVQLWNGIQGVGTPTRVIDSDFWPVGESTYYYTDPLGNDWTHQGTASGTRPGVANLLYNGYFQIVSVAGGIATMDRTVGFTYNGAGTFPEIRWWLGGAFQNAGTVSQVLSNGNVGYDVWLKGPATYYPTVNRLGWLGGHIAGGGGTTRSLKWEAYGTTRGDRAAKYTVDQSGYATTGSFNVAANAVVIGVNVIAYAAKGQTAFAMADHSTAVDCYASGGTLGFSGGSLTGFFRCMVQGATTGFNSGNFYSCVTKSCTTAGWAMGANAARAYGCIDDGSAIGFNLNTGVHLVNCVAYGGTSHGFNESITSWHKYLVGCVAYGRGGYGFAGSTGEWQLQNCAGGANTLGNYQISGAFNIAHSIFNFIALGGNPFVNAAGGNFALNNTAGAGGLLRGVSFLNTFPNGTTAGNQDVGAVQTTGGVGSGGAGAFVSFSAQ